MMSVSQMPSSRQVCLGNRSLEADHVISAVPASGNGAAALPFPSQGEEGCRSLGQQDHATPQTGPPGGLRKRQR